MVRVDPVERKGLAALLWVLGAGCSAGGISVLGSNPAGAIAALLIGGALLYGAGRRTYEAVRAGDLALELETPVRTGGRLRARLIAAARLGGATLEAELRCVRVQMQEVPAEQEGGLSIDKSVIWRSRQRKTLHASGAQSAADLSFELEPDALPTERNASAFRLEDGRFWELVCSINEGRKPLIRTFRITVEAGSGETEAAGR